MSLPPTFPSIEDAERARAELVRQIENLQAELGRQNRATATGRRLDPNEYWVWHAETRQQLNDRLVELRAIKAWISRRRSANNEALVHLRALYDAVNEEPSISPELRAAVYRVGAFLAQHLEQRRSPMKKPASPAAGRAMSKRVGVPMTERQHKALADFAKRNKVKMATWARETLFAAIERRKSGKIVKKTSTTTQDLLRRGREKIRARQEKEAARPGSEPHAQQLLRLEAAKDPAHRRKDQ